MDRKLIFVDELKEKPSGIQFAEMDWCEINKAVDERAEMVEMVHGYWIEQLHFNYDDEYCGSDYKCSCCGFNDVYDIEDYNYCPHCGAKMGGGIE
jgi:rubrerythrin